MIVTDHPIMRDGLRLCVQHEPDMQVVCEASDLTQTLREFGLCKPDIAVIDLQSPQGSGLRAMTAIRKLFPGTPLVILTTYPDELETCRRAGEGTTVVVSKTLTSEEVILAMRQAIEASRGGSGATGR